MIDNSKYDSFHIDLHDILTICKFCFEAFFIPIKIRSFVWPTILHIKKLMGMRSKETCMCVCACIDIRVYAYYMRIIHIKPSLHISELDCTSVGRALHQHHRGHGLKSYWGLNFFQPLLSQLLELCVHNCNNQSINQSINQLISQSINHICISFSAV